MFKLKRSAVVAVRWFLALWFCLTLPLVGLLTVNAYSRFICLEMAAHYVSKVAGMEAVFIGDSIIAGGGNWGWSLYGNPFAARNLGQSGYTVHQVGQMTTVALAYHPKRVFVMAGTNDFFEPACDPQRVLLEYKQMLTRLLEAETQPVVTLTPHTRWGNNAAAIDSFNASLRTFCAEKSIPAVDLNPEIASAGKLLAGFTVDGVHFNAAAYRLWNYRLRQVLHP